MACDTWMFVVSGNLLPYPPIVKRNLGDRTVHHAPHHDDIDISHCAHTWQERAGVVSSFERKLPTRIIAFRKLPTRIIVSQHTIRSMSAGLRLLLPSLLLLLAISNGHAQQRADDRPRNIIVLIGDGMGAGQLSALQLADGRSHMMRMPVGGFSITSSATHLITESGAGGTALATGVRTRNGFIAMDTARQPLPSLFERARTRGLATGVVSSSGVTHATPAAFMAHVDSRKKQHEIAAQISEGRADVIIGGGREWFLPKDAGGTREDGRDLLAALRMQGYAVAARHDTAVAMPMIMLLAQDALPPAGKRPFGLKDLTATALAQLARDEDGFVLVVEGSQIDWASHDNLFEQMLLEMRDFDAAVGVALDFAERDGRTLVMVTADHETGGLTVFGKNPDGSDLEAKWSSDDHSAAMVPVFGFGPGSARFGGIHRIDAIGRMLHDLL